MLLALALCLLPSTAASQQALVIKPLAELKVSSLSAGPLFWRIENFATLVEAQAVAAPTGLAFEYGGKVWLFKLGPADGSSLGGTKVAEVGPISPIVAAQYLLRINEASGPPGSTTAVHTSGFRLRARRANHSHSARHDARGRRATRDRSRRRRTDAGYQQRLDRFARVGDVRSGCEQTIFVAGEVPLSSS
jgi:hypothetical protein